MGGDYWFNQRYDDALWAALEEAGLCGNCEAELGPDHTCERES